MYLTAVLLGLAVAAVWVPAVPTPVGRMRAWVPLLAATLASALWHHQVDGQGLLVALLALLLADTSRRIDPPRWRPWVKVLQLSTFTSPWAFQGYKK